MVTPAKVTFSHILNLHRIVRCYGNVASETSYHSENPSLQEVCCHRQGNQKHTLPLPQHTPHWLVPAR